MDWWTDVLSAIWRCERVKGRMCVCREGHRHAPARLLNSLRLLARVVLVSVGLGLRNQLDGRLHDFGGVGDRDSAHALGVLPTQVGDHKAGA